MDRALILDGHGARGAAQLSTAPIRRPQMLASARADDALAGMVELGDHWGSLKGG